MNAPDIRPSAARAARGRPHDSPWLAGRQVEGRALRLYCFAYAGGGANTFAAWPGGLPADIEVVPVQMPGRGARFSEKPLADLPAIVHQLASVISTQAATPCAFFGHSLGALIAFETARELERRRVGAPALLMVSGCAAPQRRGEMRRLHLLDDQALVDALRDYQGTPPAILAHAELMQMLLPMLRADFELACDYAYRPAPPLAAPLVVLAGRGDERIEPDQVQAWQLDASRPIELHWFDGDHFFVDSQRDAVLACVERALRRLRPPVAALPGLWGPLP